MTTSMPSSMVINWFFFMDAKLMFFVSGIYYYLQQKCMGATECRWWNSAIRVLLWYWGFLATFLFHHSIMYQRMQNLSLSLWRWKVKEDRSSEVTVDSWLLQDGDTYRSNASQVAHLEHKNPSLEFTLGRPDWDATEHVWCYAIGWVDMLVHCYCYRETKRYGGLHGSVSVKIDWSNVTPAVLRILLFSFLFLCEHFSRVHGMTKAEVVGDGRKLSFTCTRKSKAVLVRQEHHILAFLVSRMLSMVECEIFDLRMSYSDAMEMEMEWLCDSKIILFTMVSTEAYYCTECLYPYSPEQWMMPKVFTCWGLIIAGVWIYCFLLAWALKTSYHLLECLIWYESA